MSEAGEHRRAKAPKDTCASGAKPRPEGRVREHGWRLTTRPVEFALPAAEAARRRAIEAADSGKVRYRDIRGGGR